MREENVIKFYVLCNKLKNVIRTGWLNWNVTRDRVESVAEHVYGVQMLALAMYSEYKYDLDIQKVLYMLAIHELGEAVIGDITQFEITKENKERIEHQAVHKILNGLLAGKYVEDLFLEFDKKETEEAKFAYQCDKMECDIQAKLYDEENCVDLTRQDNNPTFNDSKVQELLKKGYSWSGMWLKFGQDRYPYDKNFRALSRYVMSHKICEDVEIMDKEYIDSYKKDVISEMCGEIDDIGLKLVSKANDVTVDDLVLNEVANNLLDFYHEDFGDARYIIDQISSHNYKCLPKKIMSGQSIYRIPIEGDLKKDGYEKCLLYIPAHSSINVHTHDDFVEEYSVIEGKMSVKGVECTTNRCLFGESHNIDASQHRILIRTLKVSRELIMKKYEESLFGTITNIKKYVLLNSDDKLRYIIEKLYGLDENDKLSSIDVDLETYKLIKKHLL